MLGAYLVIPALICDELSCGQAEFPRIPIKNGQNDEVKVGELHFQYQQRISNDTCLVSIWWFYPKSVTKLSRGQGKFYERTDRQADRLKDTGNDNTILNWKAEGDKKADKSAETHSSKNNLLRRLFICKRII